VRDLLSDAEWNEIAEWVGYLPLALEVLNRVLRSGEMTAREILDLSRKQRPSAAVDQAMESIRGVVPAGALRGITEAFSASYNLLTPNEQYAARLIAWMAPAAVPTFVIDAFGPEVFALGIRAKLRNRSFVTGMRDGSGTYLGAMHRVFADFTRAQSQAPEEEAKVVTSLLTHLIDAAEGQGSQGSATVRDCAPLASSLFANCIAGSVTENNFLGMGAFFNHFGTILAAWGYTTLAGDLFGSLVAASHRWLGHEHPNTLTSMHNLALTRRERGDLAEAQELQERVVVEKSRIFGDEHPETLASMNELALTRWLRGDQKGGQDLQERVLDASRHSFGNEHPQTLAAMHNLALALHAQGDYTRAQQLQEGVLEARQRTLGDEHPDTLKAMHNLVLTRRSVGDEVGAQKLQQQVLGTMRQRLGSEHPLTTVAARVLLAIYVARGDSDATNRLLREDLLWLLDRDPASLTEQQRWIQAELREFERQTDHFAGQE
jgi:hypothetical protein